MELTINTGFLVGNLFDSWSPEETAKTDEQASAARYAELLEEALQAAFPDAAVTVNYEEGVGCLPFDLQTSVYADDEDLTGDYQYQIDSIGTDLYQSGEWVVVQE